MLSKRIAVISIVVVVVAALGYALVRYKEPVLTQAFRVPFIRLFFFPEHVFYVCKEEGNDEHYTNRALFIDIRCDADLCWDTIYSPEGKQLWESPKLGPTGHSHYPEPFKYRACKHILKGDFASKQKPYDEFVDQDDLYYESHFQSVPSYLLCLTQKNEIVYQTGIGFLDTASTAYYSEGGAYLGSRESGMVAHEEAPPVETDFCRPITKRFFQLHTKSVNE